MTTPVVVVSPTELRELVSEAVREALGDAQPAQPALVDRAELGRTLGVSPSTISRLARQGLPTVRVGEAPRYSVPDVLEWLQARGAS
jgi:hypothetical protein